MRKESHFEESELEQSVLNAAFADALGLKESVLNDMNNDKPKIKKSVLADAGCQDVATDQTDNLDEASVPEHDSIESQTDEIRALKGPGLREMNLNEISFGENVESWENLMFLYNSAIKEVRTKLDILNDEFQNMNKYNPIEYIESRLKTPQSIVKKLQRHGFEATIQNMVEQISDIAGVRIVCSFTSDIYRIAKMIADFKQFEVLRIKDYIRNPKPSGYRSYHLIVRVPISTTRDIVYTKVEIQIRTIAMDFWASLEHKIQYKFEGHTPEQISRDLRNCADIVAMLDEKMLSLNEEIQRANPDMNEES